MIEAMSWLRILIRRSASGEAEFDTNEDWHPMKSFLLVLALLAMPAAASVEAKTGDRLAQPPDIRRLTLMVALLDYPIEQNKMHSLLGLPASVKPGWGNPDPMGDKRGTIWFWPLNETNYALKVFYSDDTMETTGRYSLITGIEVVYRSPVIGWLVADPHEFPLSIAPRLKVKLKNSGLSLLEFTAPENLRKYYEAVHLEIQAERSGTKRSNRTLQPAPSPVMPPAGPEPRQP